MGFKSFCLFPQGILIRLRYYQLCNISETINKILCPLIRKLYLLNDFFFFFFFKHSNKNVQTVIVISLKCVLTKNPRTSRDSQRCFCINFKLSYSCSQCFPLKQRSFLSFRNDDTNYIHNLKQNKRKQEKKETINY